MRNLSFELLRVIAHLEVKPITIRSACASQFCLRLFPQIRSPPIRNASFSAFLRCSSAAIG